MVASHVLHAADRARLARYASVPYGISAIKGVLWYSESETSPNTVVPFDPKTEKFQTRTIPGGGNIVRNTDVTRDGNFVLANSLANEVTLVRIGE